MLNLGRCLTPAQDEALPRPCRPGLRLLEQYFLFTFFLQRFDAKTMVDNPKVSASTGMVDDGTGVKEVGGNKTESKKYFLAKNINPVTIFLHHHARKIEY